MSLAGVQLHGRVKGVFLPGDRHVSYSREIPPWVSLPPCRIPVPLAHFQHSSERLVRDVIATPIGAFPGKRRVTRVRYDSRGRPGYTYVRTHVHTHTHIYDARTIYRKRGRRADSEINTAGAILPPEVSGRRDRWGRHERTLSAWKTRRPRSRVSKL